MFSNLPVAMSPAGHATDAFVQSSASRMEEIWDLFCKSERNPAYEPLRKGFTRAREWTNQHRERWDCFGAHLQV